MVFAAAMGSPQATVSKLRSGTINKSKVPGAVLMNRKFYAIVTDPGGVDTGLAMIRSDKKTATHKPPILLATDGEDLSAENTTTGERLHIKRAELHRHFGFFLPAAGMQRYKAADENPVDIKATGQLAKLYDALLKDNPSWQTPERRHDLNLLMTRLVFCMFAEDVGIFDDNLFSRLIFTYAGDNGEEAQLCLTQAFAAMNRQKDARGDLPDWTAELPYVNGGLFADTLEVPRFYRGAYRYLKDAAGLDWREINPDIFGSMIQSVADPARRSELGMHYTSVPNILKVLGPLFLDDLDAQIDKAASRKSLQKVLDRIAGIRVFDPACGSGNFLVVAYRELRAREMAVLEKLAKVDGGQSGAMFSNVRLNHFYGIEITDFAAETAKLALFIAEYQANDRFKDVFGHAAPALPLRDGGNIVCDNALRLDWEAVCPPPGEGEEVFIAGNPPYYGAKKRERWQTEDMISVGLENQLLLDYVSAWFYKAKSFADGTSHFAFVATSSICQGEQVVPMWCPLLTDKLVLNFAYKPFMWRNSAADNAGVWVSILGLGRNRKTKRLFVDDVELTADEISPYLILGPFTPVEATSKQRFKLPTMVMGSNPVDGRKLVVTDAERTKMIDSDPQSADFLVPYLGGEQLLDETKRFCLWIEDHELEKAKAIPAINKRIEECRTYRSSAGRDAKKVAHIPHRFCYSTFQNAPALAIPNSQSSDRIFIPATMVPEGIVLSKESFAVYDPEPYLLAIVSSSIHRVWLSAVGGRIGNGFRYSVRVVYNNFPVPRFTSEQIEQLNHSARSILKTRFQHHPKTIAELYGAKDMPDDLRAAHKANDDLLEEMYIGRPFRNDTERLERLFKLYAARIEKLKQEDAA